VIDWLAEPWDTGIVARAGLALLIAGILGGAVGVVVLLRGLAFTTDAYAHTVFPGVVLAAAAGTSLMVGGLVAAIVAGLGIAVLARHSTTSHETAIAVVYTGLFAVGAILFAELGPFDRSVGSILFGSVLGTSSRDLLVLSVCAVLCLAVLTAIRRPLITTTFDPVLAGAEGTRRTTIDAIVLVVLAVVVVILTQAIGNMLVIALLVAPALTARILTRRLFSCVAAAMGIGALTALAGLYLSYYAGIATGPSVVFVAIGLAVLAWAVARAARAMQRPTSSPAPVSPST